MKLHKHLTFQIFPPEGEVQKARWNAPSRQGWPESSVMTAIEEIVEILDQNYPNHDFEMVQVGLGEYNFVCRGERVSIQHG